MKHTSKKRSIIIGIILTALVLLCICKIFLEQDASALTLKEAYLIAYEEALKWSKDAYVIQITSTDLHDTENSENGVNGKRNCWSFLFESREKEMQYAMYIDCGEPTSLAEVRSPGYKGIDMDTVTVDTSELYELAVEKGLQGGTEWAFGYHYTLQYTFMNANAEVPILTYTVRGVNQNGNEEKMIVNPFTGEIISILEKTGYDDTGRSIWEMKEGEEHIYSETELQDKEESTDREEIKEKYEVYKKAAEYLVNPEELTDAIIRGINSSRFDPFSEITVYSRDEWEKRMTELYGEKWKEW